MKEHIGEYAKIYKILVPLLISLITTIALYLNKHYGIKQDGEKVEDFPLTLLIAILITIQLLWEYGKTKIDDWDEDSEINKLRREASLLRGLRKGLVNRNVNMRDTEKYVLSEQECIDKILKELNNNDAINCGQSLTKEQLESQGKVWDDFTKKNS